MAETDTVYNKIIAKQSIDCGYAEWPPFMKVDPNSGEVSGLMHDVWEMIGTKLGLKINWNKSLGWGEITEAVKTAKVDVFCVGIWPDAGRTKSLLLSRNVFYNPLYLFARKGDRRFDNNYEILNDSAYTVAGAEGDTTSSILAIKFPKAKTAHISPMQQQGDMLMNVVSEKADVTLVDIPYIEEYSKENPDKIERVAGAPLALLPTAIPLAVGETQLKTMIDSVLTDLINDGTIAALIKKWEAKETYAPQPDVVLPVQDKSP